jgi:hypothetical protein
LEQNQYAMIPEYAASDTTTLALHLQEEKLLNLSNIPL